MYPWQLAKLVSDSIERFTPPDEGVDILKRVCKRNPDVAQFHIIGRTEEGRPISSVVLGRGMRRCLLIGGAHSDEPLGPETLRRLVSGLLIHRDRFQGLLESWRLAVIPHINPDGEAANLAWIAQWPSAVAYIGEAQRESPRDDREFGFPDKCSENRCVSDFIRRFAPVSVHVSFHGMGFAHGVLLLIEKHWAKRTGEFRRGFAAAVREVGLPFHDHNRKGEKGFHYLGPGFSTTPTSQDMKAFFREQGANRMAGHFGLSSFEFVRTLGGNPFCLATEIPLFLLDRKAEDTAINPDSYLAFRERLPELALRVHTGASISGVLEEYGVRSVPLMVGIRLQLATIELALALRTENRRCGNIGSG